MSRILPTAGALIDTIKINRNRCVRRDDRVFWVKERRPWSGPIIAAANLFFRLAGNPVRVWSRRCDWQRWEIECYQRLHGAEGFQAFAEGACAVCEQVPGEGLVAALHRNALTETMIAAAAEELRRAHALPCPELGGLWSHADPHMNNFLFDPISRRARIIDFEVAHRADLAEVERHADDLLVFLQDLMGRIDRERWLATATCFVRRYDASGSGPNGALAVLRERLRPPRGFERAWWAIRTSYLPAAERNRRITMLRASLE